MNDVDRMLQQQPPEHIAQFFSYEHLKPPLQAVSKLFSDLSQEILKLPRNPERTVALRKLLESKDAAVRAFIAKSDTRELPKFIAEQVEGLVDELSKSR